MTGPQQFRTRVFAVEAIQYRPDLCNCVDVARFCGMADATAEDLGCTDGADHVDNEFWPGDLSGSRRWARPGDWLVRFSDGNLIAVDPDGFAERFEVLP